MAILREEWRTVVTNHDFEVSNLGRVRRKPGTRRHKSGRPTPDYLATNLTAAGYPRVSLSEGKSRRAFHVHRLVADAFLGPRPPGTEVNHIDGNRKNPRVDNLEYVTPSENIRHSFACLGRSVAGERNPRAKLTEHDVLEILSLQGTMRQVDIAAKYGVEQVLISQIFRGLAWSSITGIEYSGPIRVRRKKVPA